MAKLCLKYYCNKKKIMKFLKSEKKIIKKIVEGRIYNSPLALLSSKSLRPKSPSLYF